MANEPLYFEVYLSLKRTHCKFYTLPIQRQMYLDQKRTGDSFFSSYINKEVLL